MAFGNLKQALTNTHILDYPRNEDSFILDTDTSNTCMGAQYYLRSKMEKRKLQLTIVKLLAEQSGNIV